MLSSGTVVWHPGCVGLHLAILAAGARGHRARHGNARARRKLRPVRRNFRAELRYRAGLLQLVARCRELVEVELKELEPHWPRRVQGDSISVVDGIPASIEAAIRRAAAKLGHLDTWAKRMVGIAVEANRDSVDDRLSREIKRAIGVDVDRLLKSNGPLLQSMRTATTENIALIKTIPEQYLNGLKDASGKVIRHGVFDVVTDNWVRGTRWEDMVAQVQQVGDITENRAKLIARDQTSKMNAAFNQERQQQVGIERYEWSTSDDERVRPSHEDMEGEICEWANPPDVDGEKVHPGQAINCRCAALPIVEMDELAFGGLQENAA